MPNDLHLIVSEQLPEFVRADFPTFVEFVKTYYRWLSTQSVGNIETVVDIDRTPVQFVSSFRRELDVLGFTSDSGPFQYNTRYL